LAVTFTWESVSECECETESNRKGPYLILSSGDRDHDPWLENSEKFTLAAFYSHGFAFVFRVAAVFVLVLLFCGCVDSFVSCQCFCHFAQDTRTHSSRSRRAPAALSSRLWFMYIHIHIYRHISRSPAWKVEKHPKTNCVIHVKHVAPANTVAHV